MKRVIVIIILFILNSSWVSAQVRIEQVKGRAQVSQLADNFAGYKTAKPGMNLVRNDKIRTGKDSTIEIKTGSYTVIIYENSVVQIEEMDETSNAVIINILFGSMRVMNEELVKKHNLIIRSGNSQVTPTGTDLVVNYTTGKETTLYVFKGKADVANLNNLQQSVSVDAYQMSQVKGGEAPVQPADIPSNILQQYNVPPKPKIIRPAVPSAPEVKPEVKVEQPKPEVPVKKEEPPKEEPKEEPQPEPEEKSEPWCPDPELEFHLNFDIMYIEFDGIGHAWFALMPEFKVCKIGLGLYLPVYYNYKYNFFKPSESWYNYHEWDFKSPGDSVHDLWIKILYLSYGEKGEPPLYVRIGGLNAATLGNGFIMHDYSNMVNFPRIRKLGLQFDFIYKRITGIETVFNDLNYLTMYGGRYIIYPFFWDPALGLLNDLQFGFTLVHDRIDDDNMLINWGLDFTLPLVKTDAFKCIYGIDWATFSLYAPDHLDNEDWNSSNNFGFATGFRGNLAFILYKAEYRHLSDGYIPEYFDAFYDIQKEYKYLSLLNMYRDKDPETLDGYLVHAGFVIAEAAEIGFDFQEYYGDQDTIYNKAKLYFSLKKGVIPRFYGTAAYYKLNVAGITGERGLFGRLYDENTIMTFDGGFGLTSFLYLKLTYQRSFAYDEDHELQSYETWSTGISMGF